MALIGVDCTEHGGRKSPYACMVVGSDQESKPRQQICADCTISIPTANIGTQTGLDAGRRLICHAYRSVIFSQLDAHWLVFE